MKTEEKAETKQNKLLLGVDLLRQEDFPVQPGRSGGGQEFGKLQVLELVTAILKGTRQVKEDICGHSSDVT